MQFSATSIFIKDSKIVTNEDKLKLRKIDKVLDIYNYSFMILYFKNLWEKFHVNVDINDQ